MVSKDARWPAVPLLAVRATQFVLGLMCLGMAGALINSFAGSIWELNMALTVGLFTMIYAGINFFLFFINLLLPLAIVIVDAFLLVLWLVAVAGLGDLLTRDGIFSLNCNQLVYDSLKTDCGVIKALWAFSFLTFLLFIGTTALASYILHINRKDLRGAKYNSGQDPNGNELETGQVAAPVQEVYQEHNPVAYPPQTQYEQQQQPQGIPSDGYYPQSPVPVVSPPQTPAPNPQQQYQHQQQYAPSPPPPPPPPPPVNAQEMPAYH